jgi:ribosomal protein L3 glutamine methyltransferase
MKLTQLIQEGAAQLDQAQVAFGHGTLNAHDEATWLVLWQLQMPLDMEVSDETTVDASQVVACQHLIQKRIATRKPAAYLTQEAWLQGIPFYVDERSIVPRSFIAELIADGAFDGWLKESSHQFLDLCTGNGSLAIICAMAYPEVSVVGADISADALEVAKINLAKHELQDRVQLIQSDGLKNVNGAFDCIICNPPYVCQASMIALPKEFQAEPELALAGGQDGMDFVRQLFIDLPQHMKPEAILVLEIGNEREHFEKAFSSLEAVWLETSAGEDQVLLLTREALLKFQIKPLHDST